MRATLDELSSEMGNLKSFVESISPINELLKSNADSVIEKYLRGRRKLDYVAFIVSLYAAFESFVENLVWAYTKLESSRVQYSALPEKLQRKHLKQSAELLVRARLGEGRYSDVTEEEVVTNLHDCLSGQKIYALNRSAVVHHDLNLRSDTIQDIFARIGIDNVNQKARKMEALILWQKMVVGLEGFPSELPESTISYRIDNFVERRNQISHSSTNLDNYLGSTDMLDLLNFVEAYGKALYFILASDVLRKRYILSAEDSKKLALDDTEGPYYNGFVVIIDRPDINIAKGQQIVASRNDDVTQWGHIVSIQVDGNDVEEVGNDAHTQKLGLRLEFKVTKGTQLYLLKKKENVVW
ncbi:MAG: hypothetical protein A2284_10610 [Deltaproteobacteria bacterium RIFOXYA12_FULL_61_11]|nr:MAG: hypothetical protein A2284_10610 [Deltaproteobacteria bacterium RIFOXYA12_FULL_61_11]